MRGKGDISYLVYTKRKDAAHLTAFLFISLTGMARQWGEEGALLHKQTSQHRRSASRRGMTWVSRAPAGSAACPTSEPKRARSLRRDARRTNVVQAASTSAETFLA